MKQIIKADDLHQPFLFFHSLFIIPIILLANIIQLVCIFILYFSLNVLIKKKISIVRLLVFTFAIIALNISVPKGRILFRLFDFPLTIGALESGISKALVFDCLIMVSNFSLAQAIFLKGSIGLLIYNSLDFMNRLFQKIKNRSKDMNFYEYVDDIILTVWNDTRIVPSKDNGQWNFEFLLYFYIIILLWLLFFVSTIMEIKIF